MMDVLNRRHEERSILRNKSLTKQLNIASDTSGVFIQCVYSPADQFFPCYWTYFHIVFDFIELLLW